MFTFVSNKQFGQLITISPHLLTVLKTTNAEFQSIQVWFPDQNNRLLEIDRQCKYHTNYWVDNIKIRYSTEPKYRKYGKGYDFLSLARKLVDKYGKKLMDTATKTGTDAAKTASKWVVQKTSEASGDLIRYKIADKITSVGKKK